MWGKGALLPYLHDHASTVVGVDINEWLLRHSGNPGTVIGDATKLPFRNGSFDGTMSLHALEHIPNVSAVFQELERVTINGGYSFHIFPSFVLTRVEGAILETLRMYPLNPLRAWKEAHRLHVNRLNPEKINDIIGPTNFHLIFSKRTFVPETKGINWVILLQKS